MFLIFLDVFWTNISQIDIAGQETLNCFRQLSGCVVPRKCAAEVCKDTPGWTNGYTACHLLAPYGDSRVDIFFGAVLFFT